MGLRAFTPLVTACPGCGRTTSTLFQELAKTVQDHVRAKMPEWRLKYDGVENLTVRSSTCTTRLASISMLIIFPGADRARRAVRRPAD